MARYLYILHCVILELLGGAMKLVDYLISKPVLETKHLMLRSMTSESVNLNLLIREEFNEI